MIKLRPSQRGFTLIELLTVLAIIVILGSLLLPVLNQGKNSARQVKCVSQLRQLGMAGQMYWDDNAGCAFRWRGNATNGGQIFWFGWLEDGTEGKRSFDPALGALSAYLSGRGVEVCPAFDYGYSRLKLKATGASYGYGYNLSLSAPAAAPPVNVAKVPRPAELVFLADAGQINTFQPPASPQNPMLEEFYYVQTNEVTAHFRHRGKAAVGFCDGHVSSERPLAGSIDRRLPGQILGQLRPEILSIE